MAGWTRCSLCAFVSTDFGDDSPYLSPVPHRGKRNESSYVRLVAERVAELTGRLGVARVTTDNARSLFDLDANTSAT